MDSAVENGCWLAALSTAAIDVNSCNWSSLVRGTCGDNLAVGREFSDDLAEPCQVVGIRMVCVEPRQVCSLGLN